MYIKLVSLIIVYGLILIKEEVFADVTSECESDDNKNHFTELCSWNYLEWDNLNYEDEKFKNCKLDIGPNYIPENNIPWGVAHHGARVFLAVPSTRSGIYSTLNWFDTRDVRNKKCPKLRPYPSLDMSAIRTDCCAPNPDYFVSIWSVNIDKCKNEPKMWVVDTGTIELNDKLLYVREPTLNVISLLSDKIVRRRIIPRDFFKTPHGFRLSLPNVDSDNCDLAYAYIINVYDAKIIVYSWHEDAFWAFKHNNFRLTPAESTLKVTLATGQTVSYHLENENMWTIALQRDGLLIHPRAGLTEYRVKLSDLHNRTLAACSPEGFDVEVYGQFNSQSGMHLYDEKTSTVWSVQEQNYGIACYNTCYGGPRPNKIDVVSHSKKDMPYLTDLTMDYNDDNLKTRVIYVLSNNYQEIRVNGMDKNKPNFRIWYAAVDELLKRSKICSGININITDYPKEEYKSYRPESLQNYVEYQQVVYHREGEKESPYTVIYNAPGPGVYVKKPESESYIPVYAQGENYKTVYQPVPVVYQPRNEESYRKPPTYHVPSDPYIAPSEHRSPYRAK